LFTELTFHYYFAFDLSHNPRLMGMVEFKPEAAVAQATAANARAASAEEAAERLRAIIKAQ
jgi:hypothetical protein